MSERFFGRFLLERSVITPQALLQALTIQSESNTNLGALAVQHGLLTKEEIQRLHKQQRTVDREIGELAVEQGLLSAEQTNALIDEQSRLHVRLGEALVRAGAIDRKKMESELSAFLKEQEKIEKARSPSVDAEHVFIERTARLAQNLLLRLARVQVKIGNIRAGFGPPLAFSVATSTPKMTISLACDAPVARAVTLGVLGFEPKNVTKSDDEQGLCEFFAALSQQLGGNSSARVVILPIMPPKTAQHCELHSTEGPMLLLFVPA